MRWRTLGAMLAVVLIGAGVGVASWLAKAIPVGTGLAAKHLCSLHFVSGLPVDRARALYVDPFVEPLTPFLEVVVDRQAATLEARGLGSRARARFREGYGCTLLHGDGALQPARGVRSAAPPEETVDVAHRDTHFDADAVAAALDTAFANPGGRRNTLAVAVYHDDALVAERYAEGIDAATPLPGWSMTKSVTATLVGIAVAEGRLDPDTPGILPEWAGTDDARAAITLDHLLRMTGGLRLTEDKSGTDPASQLLFLEPDAAAFSARQPLLHEVGETFDYMSGSTVLAARALREATGGTLAANYRWMQTRLFDPLGMTSAIPEPDPSGTFVGSSFMLATARDWAKLGRLYARGGDWYGMRVLEPAWIERVLTWTPESGDAAYGAGFWLNRHGAGLRHPELPEDAFAMDGFQGQFVWVVPSADLVVVRLGATAGVPTGTVPLVRALLDART